MRRVAIVLGRLLLVAACTVEMPQDPDPSSRGELSFTILFEDGEPASGFDYRFEPSVSNSGGARKTQNNLTFPNFPAQDYEFTFTHDEASEPVSTTVTVTPDAPTHEQIRLPRQRRRTRWRPLGLVCLPHGPRGPSHGGAWWCYPPHTMP